MPTNVQKQESKAQKPTAQTLEAGVEQLRLVLADTFVLYMKTYAMHWNYAGSKFFSVHKMTEEQYQELAEAIDSIAERIRAKGHLAPISLADILSSTDLEEFKRQTADDKALADLADTHLVLSVKAKEAIEVLEQCDDPYSVDMLTARSGAHEKAAWMLRSLLNTMPAKPAH